MSAWLVILILHGPGNGAWEHYYRQPSMVACEAALSTMRYEIATGGDAEQGFVAFCSSEKEHDAQVGKTR